jgi:subtilisin family serine protease
MLRRQFPRHKKSRRPVRLPAVAAEVLEDRCLLHASPLHAVELTESGGEHGGVSPDAGADHQHLPADAIPDQYIVILRDGVDPNEFAAELRGQGRQVLQVYSHALNGLAFHGPSLADDPRVLRIEPDVVVRTTAQTIPTGVNRIDAELNAVAAIDGLDERVDVDVAVLDTGVDLDHPDLNVYQTAYFIETSPDDGHGHGTHVSGTIGALDNDIGVVGVAPGARLWAVKVLDSAGSGAISGIIAGVDYVTQNAAEIDVASMSLGAPGSSTALHQAIQSSVAAGVVYVVAAGNGNPATGIGVDIYGDDFALDPTANCLFGIFCSGVEDFFPASYPEVATIAALADSDGIPGGQGGSTGFGSDDSFASFSNFSSNMLPDNPVYSPGLGIDLVLPGVDILSTWNDGGYNTISGTSMATPHASGLFALYIAQMGRDANGDGTVNGQDVSIIRQHLIDVGVAQNSANGLNTQNDPDGNPENLGWGDLDLALFVTVGDQAITKIAENGGITTAFVSRFGDTSSQITVNLANGDPSSVSLSTTSVTIAAGARTSTPFTITALDDNLGDRDQVVTITATASGLRDGIGRVTVLDEEAQWADSVVAFSSQWDFGDGSDDWMAVQATGTPDTFAYADIPTAYAPAQPDGGTQWITVGFATPVYSNGAVVRQTLGNGFVTKIEGRQNGTSTYTTLWQGIDNSPQGTPVDFEVNWTPTAFQVDALRVTFNTAPAGWEEIDAIALLGSETVANPDDTPPTVTVGAPNGGENWDIGDTQNITWSASDDVGVTTVDLFYSVTGSDGPFNLIAAGEANDSTFSWTVPNDASMNAAFVKVVARDAAGNTGSDVSNLAFTISDQSSPTVAVTAPNGGESWAIGSVQNITWTAGDNVGVTSVDLHYSVTGSAGTFNLIADGEANDGTFSWTVPNSPTTNAFVRVTAHDAATNSATDLSFAAFSITAPDTTPPAAPTGLTATAGDGQVALDWVDNTDADLAGYNVYRSTTSGTYGDVPLNSSLLATSDYTDPTAVNGTTYFYVVTAVDTSANESGQSNEASATPESNGTDDVANGETLVSGTIVSGDYTSTHASDNSYEVLRERESGGKPASRHSLLEHKWTFNVTGGETVTFFVEAYHTDNGEGDDFLFAYSTDDVTYSTMLTVTKTADDNTAESFALPAGLSGTVFVRVTDTDQTPGNRVLDTLFVDHLFIRSSGDPPAPVHDVAVTGVSAAPNSAIQGETVVVTVDVANQGNVGETFNVSLGETPGGLDLGTQQVTLAAGATTSVTFDWATTIATTLGGHTLTATAQTVAGETDTADNIGSTTVTINEPGSGSATDMYVWQMDWSEKHKGPGGSVVDLSVTIDVRYDSDADGVAEASDAPAANVSVVEFVLIHDTNGDTNFESTPFAGLPGFDRVWIGSGTTNGEGKITFTARDVPHLGNGADNGDYQGEVTALSDPAFVLVWNSDLDADNPALYTISGSGGSSGGRGGGVQSLGGFTREQAALTAAPGGSVPDAASVRDTVGSAPPASEFAGGTFLPTSLSARLRGFDAAAGAPGLDRGEIPAFASTPVALPSVAATGAVPPANGWRESNRWEFAASDELEPAPDIVFERDAADEADVIDQLFSLELAPLLDRV